MTAKEYLNLKKQQIQKSRFYWHLSLNSLDRRALEKLKLELNQSFKNYNPDLVNPLLNQIPNESPHHTFQRTINALAQSLYDDIKEYTDDKYKTKYEKTALDFIEAGMINAGCVIEDDFDKPLNGYAIFINIGTYFALNLIMKGLIVYNIHINNPTSKIFHDFNLQDFFEKAFKIFQHHDQSVTYDSLFTENELENTGNDLRIIHSMLVTNVLKFMVLHEFGHIVYDDLGIFHFNHNILLSKPNKNKQKELFQMEYRADLFALTHLFDFHNSSKKESIWAGFIAISLYLYWLQGAERKYGIDVSHSHPPSTERVKQLYNYIYDKIGDDNKIYRKEIISLKGEVEKWINKSL